MSRRQSIASYTDFKTIFKPAFGRVQESDKERRRLSFLGDTTAVLRLFHCHSRRASTQVKAFDQSHSVDEKWIGWILL
jgi:hypothetical protein